MQDVYPYIDENRDRLLDELFLLLKQPSISAHNQAVKECAQLLQRQIEQIGIPARIRPTAGHPVVFGEVNGVRRRRACDGGFPGEPSSPNTSCPTSSTSLWSQRASKSPG